MYQKTRVSSLFSIWLTVLLLPWTHSLDNGLALTPPMGWLTWERFRCETDCIVAPDDCISENLIKSMAQHLVQDGYKDVGYQYVIIDDCWMATNRSHNRTLQWDPIRFPSGIPALADYLHGMGLKFGIYADFGTKTCGGYPGSEFYLQKDAETFAEWGVDYVKLDGCHSDPSDLSYGYKAFGLYLNQTGRHMVYSCEWPLYAELSGKTPDYPSIQSACNLWRNHADVQDSWSSVKGIIDFYGENYNNLSYYAQPGAWNDPDMLDIGNFGLSYEQSRVQMVMWAMMASPLIMSNDLRNIDTPTKQLLQMKNIIAINQDTLGVQGQRLFRVNGTLVEVWSKPILPQGSFAIAFLLLDNPGDKTHVQIGATSMGLTNPAGYQVFDGFTGVYVMDVTSASVISVTLKPNSVEIVTVSPKS